MTMAEQAGEPLRDFSSPATWGDLEQVRMSLDAKIDTQIAEVKTEMAEMETRLVRLLFTAVGAGVTMLGVLIGILEAVR